MQDLQNGGLRRRRGQNFNLDDWDSEDDHDDADERRRRWELRREEMKRRILEDENLGKLGISNVVTNSDCAAANPKTQAFVTAISSSTLNVDDEPDFLGEDEIEDRKARVLARNLPNNISQGDSQSQDQDQLLSAEVQIPATSSANLYPTARDQRIIELTQIEDSQPGHVSLSEDDESDEEEGDEDSQLSFVADKVYTGFIDRAAQKRASRTASESTNRFAFKAVSNSSPTRVKRTAVSVIEADDDSARKKIMKEIVGLKTIKRKAWGIAKGCGAVTFRSNAGTRGKENFVGDSKNRKGNPDAERRRKDILTLMDSQNSFC
jgi:MRC1-like domain